MPKTERRQMRITIPVTKNELAQAMRMAKDKVDGATSSADLVRKVLSERFLRYLADRTKASKKSAPALLASSKPARLAVPPRKGSPGDAAGQRPNRRRPKDLPKPGLFGGLGADSTTERPGPAA